MPPTLKSGGGHVPLILPVVTPMSPRVHTLETNRDMQISVISLFFLHISRPAGSNWRFSLARIKDIGEQFSERQTFRFRDINA